MPRRNATHIDDPAAVGRRIREARHDAGLSQTALAFPGCSAAYLSRIESGARIPSLQVLRELGSRLGVSEQMLAWGDPGPADRFAVVVRDAELALRLDDLDEAQGLFQAAAATAGTPAERARLAAGLGQLAFRRDDLATAIDELERAGTLDAARWDPAALDTLGRAYFRSGETERAIAVFRDALARAERERDPGGRLRFAMLLANALSDVGEFVEASRLLTTILDEVSGGDPLELARLHWTQARLATQRHEHDDATRHARKAVELLDVSEHTYYRAMAHLTLGFAELDSGRPEEALATLERGRALLGDLGTDHDRGQFGLEIARALAQLGQVEEAASLAMRTAGDLRAGSPANVGRCYATVAEAYAAQGETARALELYELALELLDEPPTRYLADTLAQYGELLERDGRRDDAFAAYKRAARLNATLASVGTHR